MKYYILTPSSRFRFRNMKLILLILKTHIKQIVKIIQNEICLLLIVIFALWPVRRLRCTNWHSLSNIELSYS